MNCIQAITCNHMIREEGDRMMKDRRKKEVLCMVLLVIMAFLSIFDLDCQIPTLSGETGGITPNTVAGTLLETDSGILPDFLGTDEMQAVCNVAWICRNAAKRTGFERLNLTYCMVLCIHAICVGYAVFLFYSTGTVNRSLKFIICYIHDTDGQKD